MGRADSISSKAIWAVRPPLAVGVQVTLPSASSWLRAVGKVAPGLGAGTALAMVQRAPMAMMVAGEKCIVAGWGRRWLGAVCK